MLTAHIVLKGPAGDVTSGPAAVPTDTAPQMPLAVATQASVACVFSSTNYYETPKSAAKCRYGGRVVCLVQLTTTKPLNPQPSVAMEGAAKVNRKERRKKGKGLT